MRILVVSDTHGNSARFLEIVKKHDDIDTVVFLGDGLSDLGYVNANANRTLYYVRGNCDWSSDAPKSRFVELGGKKVFITHGHEYSVKFGLESLIEAANARRADLVLFGHTHAPYNTYMDGLYIVNPGSLCAPQYGSPTYAVIDVSPSGIMPNIINA